MKNINVSIRKVVIALFGKTVGPLTKIVKFVYQLGLLAIYQLLQIVYNKGHL